MPDMCIGSHQRQQWGRTSLRVVAAWAVLAPGGAARVCGVEPDAQLERLLANLPQPGVVCSAQLVDLDTGTTICEREASRPVVPASVAKVFVLAAAVDLLGPDFEFRTVLARRGSDLVVIGDGDPSLYDAKVAQARGEPQDAVFERWAEALQAQGLASVPGDLVIDESVFDAEFVHPAWEKDDLKKWYAAPVGALNCNDNCVDLTIWPADRAGAPVGWAVVPRADLIEIVNRCTSGGKGEPLIDRPEPSFRFIISGQCSKRWEFPSIPAPDPGLLFAGALRTALADRSIVITGATRRGRVRGSDGSLPPDCRVIAEQVTPLPPLLARAGKNSQNLFAECLLKRLGYEWARRRGQPNPQGTWETGRAAMAAFLVRAGADPTRTIISDGSGLSRDNRTSAADLVAVLRYMNGHPQRDLFVNSLAEAGSDGTLGKRLKDLPGRVFAKTGYLRGVRTMSGYAVTPQGRRRAFAVLFNGFKGGAAAYNAIHDQICRTLATDPPGDQR